MRVRKPTALIQFGAYGGDSCWMRSRAGAVRESLCPRGTASEPRLGHATTLLLDLQLKEPLPGSRRASVKGVRIRITGTDPSLGSLDQDERRCDRRIGSPERVANLNRGRSY